MGIPFYGRSKMGFFKNVKTGMYFFVICYLLIKVKLDIIA